MKRKVEKTPGASAGHLVLIKVYKLIYDISLLSDRWFGMNSSRSSILQSKVAQILARTAVSSRVT